MRVSRVQSPPAGLSLPSAHRAGLIGSRVERAVSHGPIYRGSVQFGYRGEFWGIPRLPCDAGNDIMVENMMLVAV